MVHIEMIESSDRPRFVRKKGSEDEDRISSLPDTILSGILSRLPTEDAVRTCVLSKRWAYLWSFINKLHFEDMPHSIKRTKKKKARKKRCFVDFVYRVLLHLSSSSIVSFSLLLSDPYNPSHVNAWISTILNRKVQILTIRYPYELTISLFRCNSLGTLELQMNCTVRVPSRVCIPNLKTPKLSGVKFKSASSSTSKGLIISFPVLKRFELECCAWSNVHNVSLQVPLLEVVFINLRSKTDNCTLEFCASRLRAFSYFGPPSQYYTLSHSSSALNASANIYFRLTAHVGYVIDGEEEEEEDTQLEIGLRACKLLSQFSRVKFLRLVESTGVSKFDEELVDSTVVPNCVIATLKAVKLGDLKGYDYELSLAKFVMENALVLERLSFSPTCSLRNSKSKMAEIKKKLLSFKKGSNLTIIDFSDV